MEPVYAKYKIIVIGEPSVGKTTLMLRYTEKKFKELYIPTVGVQVSVKQVHAKIGKEKKLIELNIWDIGGHSKFHNVRKMFYAGANAYLLLYDITSAESYEGTTFWQEDLEKEVGTLYGILIGNKKDLRKERVIEEKKGVELAKNFNLEFRETSAKTGENVNEVFDLLAENLLKIYG